MAQKYTHLSYEERKRIGALRVQRKSISEIARILGRNKSTISRELQRPKHHGAYDSQRSEAHANRLKRKPRRPRKIVGEVEEVVKQGLKDLWSPQQIAGRIKRVRPELSVSHQCVYDWLYRDKKEGGSWCAFLRINRRKRYSIRGRIKLANRVGIDMRPKSVDSRRYFGDWEGDTLQGKLNSGAIATLVERKSLFTVLAHVASKQASILNKAVAQRFSLFPGLPKRTLTLDNGTEFAGHMELAEALGVRVYFAAPQASWQRGLNENTNGLLRQYLPKKTDFSKVSPERIAEIQDLLNNRPRKKLGYRTPAEIMAKRKTTSSLHL